MAARFKAPSMDWTGAGNVHKRFKIFKQKCQLIFVSPLAGNKNAFVWVGEKGLQNNITATRRHALRGL